MLEVSPHVHKFRVYPAVMIMLCKLERNSAISLGPRGGGGGGGENIVLKLNQISIPPINDLSNKPLACPPLPPPQPKLTPYRGPATEDKPSFGSER
jgi:hypothetical protein